MHNVLIQASSRYPVRRKRIKETITRTLETYGILGMIAVEIEIIGDRKMRQLKREHLGIDETTDVLSFPLHERLIDSYKSSIRSGMLNRGSWSIEGGISKKWQGETSLDMSEHTKQAEVKGLRFETFHAKSASLNSSIDAPDGIMRLGNIFISYPQAQRQANLHKLTIDEEINQLVEHGILHLIGIHHD